MSDPHRAVAVYLTYALSVYVQMAACVHHGHYLAKLGTWLLFNAFPFLLPNNVVEGYGESAADEI